MIFLIELFFRKGKEGEEDLEQVREFLKKYKGGILGYGVEKE
jgi:hypothetical protein